MFYAWSIVAVSMKITYDSLDFGKDCVVTSVIPQNVWSHECFEQVRWFAEGVAVFITVFT